MEKELRAKRTSELLGYSLLFFMALLFLYMFLAGHIRIENGTARLAVLTVAKATALLLPTAAVFLVMKRRGTAFPELPKKGLFNRHLIGASSVGFIAAVQILYAAVFPTTVVSMGVTKQTAAGEYVLLFLLYVLLPAVLEELFFRHTVLRALFWQGGVLSLLISALAFGLMHFSLTAFPIAFFCGLVLGSAYLATGSPRTVIAIHFFCNALWYAAEIVRVMTLAERSFMQTVFTVAVVLSAVGIPTLRTTLSAILSENETEPASASSFWSAPVIVFLVLAVAAQILLRGGL